MHTVLFAVVNPMDPGLTLEGTLESIVEALSTKEWAGLFVAVLAVAFALGRVFLKRKAQAPAKLVELPPKPIDFKDPEQP